MRPDGEEPVRDFMGSCPYAEMFLEATATARTAAAVFATSCDQMRRAADQAAARMDGNVFLMNVPATWQSSASRQLYRSEVERLGGFLVRLGGTAPSPGVLAEEMRRHDRLRSVLLDNRAGLSSRKFAETLGQYWLDGTVALPARAACGASGAMPLAIVGETLLPAHFDLFDWIDTCGGRIALDATSGGERGLPSAFDPARIDADPFATLVEGYFNGIPDVFQRPNTRLYDWLRPRLRERGIRGIVLWHYAWCDLWHAEVNRIRDEFQVPVLHLDAGNAPSLKTRVEAFLEILRA